MSKIKLGIDIHGVIDQNPIFATLAQTGLFEVHIVTGIKEELDDVVDFPYDKWFSIHQECLDRGIDVKYDDKDRPLVDPAIWDKMKAEYCAREGIDIMIDDSPSYGQYFEGLSTAYLRYENTQRTNWRKDGSYEPKESPV